MCVANRHAATNKISHFPLISTQKYNSEYMNWALKSRLYGYKCTRRENGEKRPKFSMLSLWTNVYDRMGFTFAWPITIFFRNVSFQKKCTKKKKKKKMEARLEKKKMKGHIFHFFFACMCTFSGFLGIRCVIFRHFQAIHTYYLVSCWRVLTLFVKYSSDSQKLKVQNGK